MLICNDIPLLEQLETLLVTQAIHLQSLPSVERLGVVVSQCLPHLIVLDSGMDDTDTLSVLGWLRNTYPQIPVLVLASDTQPVQRLQWLEQGATDYLLKPFHPRELFIRILSLLPAKPMDQSLLVISPYCQFDPVNECLFRNGQRVRLTHLEARLLLFFYHHIGQVLTRDAISQALNGTDLHPLNRSIDMAVNRLRKKLGESQRNPRHLLTVWRKGYRFVVYPDN
ncbi:MAG: response regulator transcription factor [Thiothrix sp.]